MLIKLRPVVSSDIVALDFIQDIREFEVVRPEPFDHRRTLDLERFNQPFPADFNSPLKFLDAEQTIGAVIALDDVTEAGEFAFAGFAAAIADKNPAHFLAMRVSVFIFSFATDLAIENLGLSFLI